jgi:hypothetical protein
VRAGEAPIAAPRRLTISRREVAAIRLPEETDAMPNIKYYSISPSSSGVPLIGTPNLYVWFADSSGSWVRGDQVGTPPTGAPFALVAVMPGGDSPSGGTYIDVISTAGTKDPYPPPPPPLAAGTSEATYNGSFSSLVPRSVG